MPDVVSGGQTGADRAALDAALALGVTCGGWCPRGRWAEDGTIAPHYPLRPTPLARVIQRTRWNVRDSDATLVLLRGRMRGGTRMTQYAAARLGRPWVKIDPTSANGLRRARSLLRRHRVRRLNVAGPRESEAPGLYDLAYRFMTALLVRRPMPLNNSGKERM